MAAIPALSRNYFTRANVPFGVNNTTSLILQSYHTWALVHLLTNQLATGSTGGTRHANSVWICRGSSDGVGGGGAISSPGVAGTNLWWNAGTFPPAGLVRGSNGTNHHWILLENVTLGYELLFNFTQNDTYLCMSLAPSGKFAGGSATTCPAPSPTSSSVQLGQTAFSGTDGGQYTGLFGDYGTTGAVNYLHFTCADNGEFWCSSSRAGYTFTSFVGVWRSTGQNVLDTKNTFLLAGNYSGTARGTMIGSQLAGSTVVASIQPYGGQKASGGIIMEYVAGTAFVTGQGADQVSSQFDVAPFLIGEFGQKCRRGALPDAYMVNLDMVGAPIPAPGADQTHVIIGDTIWPCVVVQPLI